MKKEKKTAAPFFEQVRLLFRKKQNYFASFVVSPLS